METIYNFDFAVLDGIQNIFGCGFLDFLMPLISLIGGGYLWAVTGLVLLFIKRQRINGITILSALIVTVLITEFLIKPIFMRERPFIQNDDFFLLVKEPFGSSFPSAHTSTSFASSVPFFRINRKIGISAVIFAFLVAFSRLYLYVHFPTDVITGAFIGIIFGFLSAIVADKIRTRKAVNEI